MQRGHVSGGARIGIRAPVEQEAGDVELSRRRGEMQGGHGSHGAQIDRIACLQSLSDGRYLAMLGGLMKRGHATGCHGSFFARVDAEGSSGQAKACKSSEDARQEWNPSEIRLANRIGFAIGLVRIRAVVSRGDVQGRSTRR